MASTRLRPNPITPQRPTPMTKRPRPTEGTVAPPNDERNIVLLVGLWALIFVGIIWVAWPALNKPPVRQIRVGSQVCGVRFVQTGQFCSSWGTCSPTGYDEAVCPSKENADEPKQETNP